MLYLCMSDSSRGIEDLRKIVKADGRPPKPSFCSVESENGLHLDPKPLNMECICRSLVVRSASQTKLDTKFLLAILNECFRKATRSSSNKWSELKPPSDSSSYLKVCLNSSCKPVALSPSE